MQGQQNMNKEQTNNDKIVTGDSGKCFKCRTILENFLEAKPEIRSLECVKEPDETGIIVNTGDIRFSVFLHELGITRDSYTEYENELFSNFLVDFFGEFLIRENVGKFVDLIATIEPQEYMKILSRREHKRFGMKVRGNVIIFVFHIDLLQHILTDDIRRI